MTPPPDAVSSSGAAARRSAQIAPAGTGKRTGLPPVGKVPAVPVRDVVASSSRLAEAVYRGLEILFAAIGLTLAMPLMLIVAILICWDSPGPALFFHQRPGRSSIMCGCELRKRRDLLPPPGGYERECLYFVPSYFRLPKFRTMYSDARTRFPEYYAYKFAPGEFHRQYPTNRCDPRLTRVGRILRKLSVDELPNLWCVLTGQIRLVGPRPEAPEVLQYYKPKEMYKFACKPGITGLAQINGRGLLNWGETLAWDLQYVSTRSVCLDLKIIAITLKHVVTRHGAF
jgi:lipopolysaccharide/colanic/teichoic acid biosynthesis glycosyltransferase